LTMRRPHIADQRSRTSLRTTAPVQPGPHRIQKPHDARSLTAIRIILWSTSKEKDHSEAAGGGRSNVRRLSHTHRCFLAKSGSDRRSSAVGIWNTDIRRSWSALVDSEKLSRCAICAVTAGRTSRRRWRSRGSTFEAASLRSPEPLPTS